MNEIFYELIEDLITDSEGLMKRLKNFENEEEIMIENEQSKVLDNLSKLKKILKGDGLDGETKKDFNEQYLKAWEIADREVSKENLKETIEQLDDVIGELEFLQEYEMIKERIREGE